MKSEFQTCLALILLSGGVAPAQTPPVHGLVALEDEIRNAPTGLPVEVKKASQNTRGSATGSESDGVKFKDLPRWATPWVLTYEASFGAPQRFYSSNESISADSIRINFPLAPFDVQRRRQDFVFCWNPTARDEFKLRTPLISTEARFSEPGGRSGAYHDAGVGDLALDYNRYFYNDLQHINYLTVGALLPTGDYDERVQLSDGTSELLPYALQRGRGHFEARVGAGHRRPLDRKTDLGFGVWGSFPIENNDREYSYGASLGAQVYYEHDLFNWLTLRPRITARWADSIDGSDSELDRLESPLNDPVNYGGTSFDVGLVGVYYLPGDPYHTRYLLVGIDYTFWRDTPGIQLSEDWVLQLGFGWRY